MKKMKRFLRANAVSVVAALCAVCCIIALAVLAFQSAKEFTGSPIIIQPIAVRSSNDWLAAYRPVTFGDCPTLAPPETTDPKTEQETAATQVRHEIKVVEITEPSVNDSCEEEREDNAEYGRSLGWFTCTAYCGCLSCNEEYRDEYGPLTSTGVHCQANHTIAVDPSVIPYGTWVVINGITYKAEDCGGDIIGHLIDIYFDSHAATVAFGTRTYEVFLA